MQERWHEQPGLLPPVIEFPPQRGMPALETNHPFTCRFTPMMSLGPSCNHDIDVLLRMPVFSEEVKATLEEYCRTRDVAINSKEARSNPQLGKLFAELNISIEEILTGISDHEYYVSAYASKEQPKIHDVSCHTTSPLQRHGGDKKRRYQIYKSISFYVRTMEKNKIYEDSTVGEEDYVVSKGYSNTL